MAYNSASNSWATRQPVIICRACGFPCVGRPEDLNCCPICGQQNVLDHRDGMMKPWDRHLPWGVPQDCLVVTGEKIEI